MGCLGGGQGVLSPWSLESLVPSGPWSKRPFSSMVRAVALVVFLRGVNVGGHRRFRPSLLAREMNDYDVVNVGAAGTFVVRKPGSPAKFRTALLRKLPFEAEVVLCDGRDLMRLETENPFATEPSASDVVRFVSILSKAGGVRASLPVTFPSDGEWLVRVIASRWTIRVRDVPPSDEDDRLSWPDRQTLRCASDDTELEHDNRDRADLEGPGR